MATHALIEARRGNVYVTGGTFTNHDSPQTPGQGIPLNRIALDAFHDAKQRYPPPKCHPGTRDAVLGIIETWMASRSAEPILWLHGTAGVGKSAILQTTCESSMGEDGPVSAAFFFGRSQGQRGLSEYLIPTLAHQLSQSNDNYRDRLRNVLETNVDVFSKAMRAQMRTLLIKPLMADGWVTWLWQRAGWRKDSLVFVIDGLDECDGETNQTHIIEMLVEATQATTTHPIRFLVASRPEAHILKAFNRLDTSSRTKRVPLDESFKPADAIRLFLIDQFHLIVEDNIETLSHAGLTTSWPGEEIITILVVAAEGQFIYAHLVVAFVKMPHTDPLQQLQIVLDAARNHVAFSTLDMLYLQILRHVAPHLQNTLKQTLTCLVVLAEPQTVTVLASIISVNETEVRLVLEQLRAILRADSRTGALFDHPITFAHASFRDFLIDPNRSEKYTIDITLAHNVILAQLSSVIPSEPKDDDPISRYALDADHLSY